MVNKAGLIVLHSGSLREREIEDLAATGINLARATGPCHSLVVCRCCKIVVVYRALYSYK